MKKWVALLAWFGLTAWLLPLEIWMIGQLCVGNLFFASKWWVARMEVQRWMLQADQWQDFALDARSDAYLWQNIAMRSPRQSSGTIQ